MRNLSSVSVAALLLKRAGWDVIGVTMDLFGNPGEPEGKCCSFDDRRDALRDHLDRNPT